MKNHCWKRYKRSLLLMRLIIPGNVILIIKCNIMKKEKLMKIQERLVFLWFSHSYLPIGSFRPNKDDYGASGSNKQGEAVILAPVMVKGAKPEINYGSGRKYWPRRAGQTRFLWVMLAGTLLGRCSCTTEITNWSVFVACSATRVLDEVVVWW